MLNVWSKIPSQCAKLWFWSFTLPKDAQRIRRVRVTMLFCATPGTWLTRWFSSIVSGGLSGWFCVWISCARSMVPRCTQEHSCDPFGMYWAASLCGCFAIPYRLACLGCHHRSLLRKVELREVLHIVGCELMREGMHDAQSCTPICNRV